MLMERLGRLRARARNGACSRLAASTIFKFQLSSADRADLGLYDASAAFPSQLRPCLIARSYASVLLSSTRVLSFIPTWSSPLIWRERQISDSSKQKSRRSSRYSGNVAGNRIFVTRKFSCRWSMIRYQRGSSDDWKSIVPWKMIKRRQVGSPFRRMLDESLWSDWSSLTIRRHCRRVAAILWLFPSLLELAMQHPAIGKITLDERDASLLLDEQNVLLAKSVLARGNKPPM